jgi:hypothetical protein
VDLLPESHLALCPVFSTGEHPKAATCYLFAEQPEEYVHRLLLIRLSPDSNCVRFAGLLWEWSQQGYRTERDLFIARAVLQ